MNVSGGLVVVNAGSSSIKLTVFSGDERVVDFALENIDQAEVVQYEINGTEKVTESLGDLSHKDAIIHAIDWLKRVFADGAPEAIGHRVVHGADEFSEPTLLTGDVRARLETLTSLDPDHMPMALKLIDSLVKTYPKVEQVLCFDTAFYKDLPELARAIAFPREYRAKGMRRYGFHGLSYESLLNKLTNKYGQVVSNSKVLLAHMGSGVSVTACVDGRPVDTSMGLTPGSGVMMSTRSGDVDPGLAGFLLDHAGLKQDEFYEVASKKAGLLGVSGMSADMYTLLQAMDSHEGAKEAVELFCYQIAKTMGAFTAAMGGVDAIVFAGGIGERSEKIRSLILRRLEFLGVKIDNERNNVSAERISSDTSQIAVYVLHSDEAQVVAIHTRNVLANQKGGN